MKDDVSELPALTGLRSVGALWVLAHHSFYLFLLIWPATRMFARFSASGNLGVDLFFALSGFIITHNYLSSLGTWSRREAGRFIWLRLARIYPLHILAIIMWTALSLFLAGRPGDPAQSAINHELFRPVNVVMNLGLMNHIYPAQSIATTSWSVCLEFGAYLSFPLLALFLIRLRSPWISWLLAGVVILGGTWVLWNAFSHDLGILNRRYSWVRLATQFLGGCLLNVGWRQVGRLRFGLHWDVVAAIALAGISAACLMADPSKGGLFFPVLASPFLGLLVLACAGSTGPARWVLTTAPAMWLGRISFSLYMTHLWVLTVARKAIGRIWDAHPPSDFERAVTFVGLLVILIGTAALVFYLVEETTRRRMRNWWDDRWSRVLADGPKS